MAASPWQRRRVRVSVGARESIERELAGELRDLVRERAAAGSRTVVGLPTGRSPQGVYRELLGLARAGELSFATVVSFNLDEYVGLPAGHPASFRAWMGRSLFEHVDMAPERFHVPPGDAAGDALVASCAAYEQAIRDAGGIDWLLLGIGLNGHIAFNEPGSPVGSRTRAVRLDPTTRAANLAAFSDGEEVPERAVTMGLATILEARRVRLLAFGAAKARPIRLALQGPVTPELPASCLQGHPDAAFHLDEAAAAELGP